MSSLHEHVGFSRELFFVGNSNLNETDRRDYYDLFGVFGDVKKLFISKDGSFGSVIFTFPGSVNEAVKQLHKAPPLFLNLSFSDPRNEVGWSRASSSNGSVASNMDGYIEAGKCVMYDVYGNAVDVFDDDDGVQYVPYYQMIKAGYKLYSKDEIAKQLKNNDRLINEFNLYMLTKARKFMIENKLGLNEKLIEETIDRCRKKIFSPTTEDNFTAAPTNIKLTVRQDINTEHNQRTVFRENNAEQQNNRRSTGRQDNTEQNHSRYSQNNTPEQYPKKLRHPKHSPNTSQQSSIFDTEVKKFTTVKLQEGCFNKVVITHVEGPNTCYVAPFDIISERNRIMGDVAKFSSTGKTADIFKNLIYACNCEQTWYRAKILKKDQEVEALLIDDGRKVIVHTAVTLPKGLIDLPGQVVLIMIKNDGVVLEKGATLEIKPIQTLDNGYLVEAKSQTTTNEIKTRLTEKPKTPQTRPNKPRESSRTPTKSPTKTEITAPQAVKSTVPPRKCLIDKAASIGLISCTEIVDSETFVASLLSEEFCDEMNLLEEIGNDCVADPNYKPQLGDVVAVEKKDDNQWVRGVVCEIKNNAYQCALIDYGVKQLCDETRKLPAKFVDLPYFSCICKADASAVKKIAEVTDGGSYTVKQAGKLEITIDDETLLVMAKCWNPVNIQTSVENKINPPQVSVETKQQISTTPKSPLVKKDEPVSEKPKKVQTSATEKPKKVEIAPRKCIIDKVPSTGLIVCSDVVDSETFIAYLFSTDIEDEVLLLEEIGNDCVADESYKPQLGDLVAVEKRDEPEKWVRGLLCDIKNNEYQCALVDYGVMETSHKVRKLPEKYLDIPVLSCICRTDPDALKKLVEVNDEFSYTIKKPKLLEIQLDSEILTAIAECWNPVKESPKKQKTYKPLPSYTLNDGDFLKVKSIDEEIAALFCETKRCFGEKREIEAYIKTFTPEPLTNPPEVGQLVLSPWADEEGLFRGIVKKCRDNEVEIDFLDYGNCDTVKINQLRNVDEKLASYGPGLVQSPKFWYFEGRKLSVDSYTFLAENVAKKYKVVNCNAKFDLVDTEGKFLSEILQRLDNKKAHKSETKPKSQVASANSSFSSFKEDVAPHNSSASAESSKRTSVNVVKSEPPKTKTPHFTFSELPVNDFPPGTYEWMCSYMDDVESGTVTFLHSIDDLGELQDKIEKYIETDNKPFDANESDLCLALYEGCWCRGVVVEIFDSGFQIYFVDYGNSTLIDRSGVRNVNEELVKYPPLAVICQLDGISEEILKALKAHLVQNDTYEVELVGKIEENHLIRIPEVYGQIKDLLQS